MVNKDEYTIHTELCSPLNMVAVKVHYTLGLYA